VVIEVVTVEATVEAQEPASNAEKRVTCPENVQRAVATAEEATEVVIEEKEAHQLATNATKKAILPETALTHKALIAEAHQEAPDKEVLEATFASTATKRGISLENAQIQELRDQVVVEVVVVIEVEEVAEIEAAEIVIVDHIAEAEAREVTAKVIAEAGVEALKRKREEIERTS